MSNLVAFAPRSPVYRKSAAAHSRALAAPMHPLHFVGEPMGITTFLGRGMAPGYAARRAALWAIWKAQKVHGLPDDLSDWKADCRAGGSAEVLYLVTLTPANARHGWEPVTVPVPAWAVAEGDGGMILDAETDPEPPRCAHTAILALPAPRAPEPPEPAPRARQRRSPAPKLSARQIATAKLLKASVHVFRGRDARRALREDRRASGA